MESEDTLNRYKLGCKRFFVSVTCSDDQSSIECTNAADDAETLKRLLKNFKMKRSAEAVRVFDSKQGLAWVCILSDLCWKNFYSQISEHLGNDDLTEPETLCI